MTQGFTRSTQKRRHDRLRGAGLVSLLLAATLLLAGCGKTGGSTEAQYREALDTALEQAGASMGPYTVEKQKIGDAAAAAKELILRFLRDLKTEQAGRSFTLPEVREVKSTLKDGAYFTANAGETSAYSLAEGQWQVAFEATVTVTGTVGQDTLKAESSSTGLTSALLEDAGSYFVFYPTAASYERIHSDTRYQSLESAGEAAEPYRIPTSAATGPQDAAEQLVRQFAEARKQEDAQYSFTVQAVTSVQCELYDGAYFAKNAGQCEPSPYSLTAGQWQVSATCGLRYTGEINGISPETLQAEFGTDVYTDMIRYGLLEETDGNYVFYPMPACYERAVSGAGK